MAKAVIAVLSLILIVSALFALAQPEQLEECGFWCRLGEFFSGREEAVVKP